MTSSALPTISPILSLVFLFSPEIISFPPSLSNREFLLFTFFPLTCLQISSMILLHFRSPFLDSHPFDVLLSPMLWNTLLFPFEFFYKSRLSYPWPDLLPWLMTHVLLLLLAEIMELVICSRWPLLFSGLAASPCPSPEGLLPAPPLTSRSPRRTPPHLSATFYSTFFFLSFCPPPYFCDDKMGLEGPLTGQLVPFCCSKSGSTIIEELLIQHALKILQQRGCRDLQELLLVGTGKKQRRSERGKMSQSLPGEAMETCALPGWPQCMSHLDVPPPLRYDACFLPVARCLCSSICIVCTFI